jgi:hypothetical protein
MKAAMPSIYVNNDYMQYKDIGMFYINAQLPDEFMSAIISCTDLQ